MQARRKVSAYLEKEHPDWLRALTPRHINAPVDYWPQKVLTWSLRRSRLPPTYRCHKVVDCEKIVIIERRNRCA